MFGWIKTWWRERGRATGAAGIGRAGERLARDFLRKQEGYRIVARNWRSPRDRRDEIDLICRDGEVLVFVEVKARAAGALVPGYYAVNQAKRRVMLRACRDYLLRLRVQDRPATFRFDVVEVESGWPAPEVRHFENVPLFPKNLRW